jgi:hypothetical protein
MDFDKEIFDEGFSNFLLNVCKSPQTLEASFCFDKNEIIDRNLL